MLTKKQYELLVYIDERLKDTCVSPSFDEMKNALGLASKSGIHRLITGLVERGFIRRRPHRARALEILRHPEREEINHVKPRVNEFVPNVVKGDFKMVGAEPPLEVGGTIQIPRYEKIVDGESMIDEGIHDGDTVIIRHTDSAENGNIVVAIIDNEEVTLKRLRRKGNSVALEAANKDFETRIFGPSRVKVQGRLVGLIRKY